jgi:hypothetical protein
VYWVSFTISPTSLATSLLTIYPLWKKTLFNSSNSCVRSVADLLRDKKRMLANSSGSAFSLTALAQGAYFCFFMGVARFNMYDHITGF